MLRFCKRNTNLTVRAYTNKLLPVTSRTFSTDMQASNVSSEDLQRQAEAIQTSIDTAKARIVQGTKFGLD